MTFVVPPPLQPGDRVVVVAPASPLPRVAFYAGLGWLRQRYEVRVSAAVLERTGYLAGSDARRTSELARAMVDPGVRAVIAARGGYGITRIVGALPWAAFAKEPKWIVGFSDVTALHVECWRAGVASVHGPNVTGLGRATPWQRSCFMAALEAPGHPREWPLVPLVRGSARGAVVGGNLALLAAQAAAGRLLVPDGAVVAIEDVAERPYRVDRMLTSLGPHLVRAGAIVFGSFTDCDAGPDGVTVDEVLGERARALGVPAAHGAPFGHGAQNEAFVLGRHAQVEIGIDSATLRFV